MFVACSKSDNTSLYCCPTICEVPFTIAVISPFVSYVTPPLVVAVVLVFLLNVLVNPVTFSPSIYTVISLFSNASVVSKYLSITLSIIVSVFAVSSFVADCFSILGFIKSTWPSSNSCSLLVFDCPSVVPELEPSAIAQQLYVWFPPYVAIFPPVSVLVPVFCELNRTSDDRDTRTRTPNAALSLLLT